MLPVYTVMRVALCLNPIVFRQQDMKPTPQFHVEMYQGPIPDAAHRVAVVGCIRFT